jgi:hypothetical protein
MTNRPRDRTEAHQRVDELVAGDPRVVSGRLREDGGQSPPLSVQTPGLDETRPLRDVLMRAVAWVRERPDLCFGLLAGAAVVAGAFIARRGRGVE